MLFKNSILEKKQVKVQVLASKRIGQKLFRLKIRDLCFYDNFVCQEEQHMAGVIPGDLVETVRAFCIKIPQLGRTSAMLGPTTLIEREKDLNLTSIPRARTLPDQFTSLTYMLAVNLM